MLQLNHPSVIITVGLLYEKSMFSSRERKIYCTLDPAYNEQKETDCFKYVLLVTELFDTTAQCFDAKRYACFSRVLIVTELIVSGTQFPSLF